MKLSYTQAMLAKLKKRIITAAEKAGYVIVRRTSESEVLELLRSLYPKNSGHALIRMGGEKDGGYLIPNDLEGVSACFSPGVDETSAFERDCAGRGMELFLTDASVDQVGPELQAHTFTFDRKFIGISNDEQFLTLQEWVESQVVPQGDYLLQMDIEGAEYEAFLNCSDQFLDRFRVICIELHHICEWWNPRFFQFASKALGQITKTHDCVHIHPNNSASIKRIGNLELPNVMELTFLRKDRMKGVGYCVDFPHPLDADCVDYKPSMDLPDCWYAASR